MGASASVILPALFAHATEIAICYPFDTVKTRMQAQQSSQSNIGSSKTLYRGPLHCAVVTVQKEGWGALYRGLPCALFQCLIWALFLLWCTDSLRRAIDATISSPLSFLLACSVIGALETLLLCPLDLLKARLQAKTLRRRALHSGGSGSFSALSALAGFGSGPDGKVLGGEAAPLFRLLHWFGKQSSSALKAARDVAAARGWLGLYSGWVFHFAKETVGAIAMLGVYDTALLLFGNSGDASHRTATQHLHPQGMHWAHLWPVSCVAAIAYSVASYPFDTLKTRRQADSLTSPQYRSSLQVVVSAWQNDTAGSLYRGFQAVLCRAIPGSAIKVLMFELSVLLLDILAKMPLRLDHEPFDYSKLDHMEYILI